MGIRSHEWEDIYKKKLMEVKLWVREWVSRVEHLTWHIIHVDYFGDEIKAGMVSLQCNNCVIHTWALQRRASHNGSVYKSSFLYLLPVFGVQWFRGVPASCLWECSTTGRGHSTTTAQRCSAWFSDCSWWDWYTAEAAGCTRFGLVTNCMLLCRSAWVWCLSPSVRLFVCLFVESINK